jgi:hypothetical protein
MVCSQCSIPRSCSKRCKCQATAWASGHSKHCRCRADLKYTHALMKETLDVISHAAAARSIHGIHTYPVRDFMFATVVMDPQIQWIKHQFLITPEDIEGPSMKFYYQNLAAIRRGEWWVFTDQCTKDDFQEILESKASALVVAQQGGELPQVHWLVWNRYCSRSIYDASLTRRKRFGRRRLLYERPVSSSGSIPPDGVAFASSPRVGWNDDAE